MASTSLSISGVEINIRVDVQGRSTLVLIAAKRGVVSSSTTLILRGEEAAALPDELNLVKACFQYFDSNGDGQISKTEIRKVFPDCSERNCRDLFARLDKDLDGYINYSEFLDFVLLSATTAQSQVNNERPKAIQARGSTLARSKKNIGRSESQRISRQAVANILEDDFGVDIHIANTGRQKSERVSGKASADEMRMTSSEATIRSAGGGYATRLKSRKQKADLPITLSSKVPAVEASGVGGPAVPLSEKRQARRTEALGAEAQVAEPPQQPSELLNTYVVTNVGITVGKSTTIENTTSEPTADPISLRVAYQRRQTLARRQVALEESVRHSNTAVKDANGTSLAILPTPILDDTTIQRAIDGLCRGGVERDNVERGYGHISKWDTSSVTNMSKLFQSKEDFVNEDLNQWNVGNVTDMSYMFHEAASFNGNLGAWNVGRVTTMSFMFAGAESFNGDLSTWDVSRVTSMTAMFQWGSSFNGDLSTWDVGKVTDMARMFQFADSFNRDLSAWDVVKATDMNYMFQGSKSFNGDLSKWKPASFANGVTLQKLKGQC